MADRGARANQALHLFERCGLLFTIKGTFSAATAMVRVRGMKYLKLFTSVITCQTISGEHR